MHYIPESTCEMLRNDPTASGRAARSNFHYQSAPLYLLTGCVAALLLFDTVLSSGLNTGAALGSGPVLFGWRYALLAAVLGGARIVYHALDGILSGRIGADLALTIACLAAIVLGEHQTAGLVVLISLIGESLEGYTIDRARWAVRQTFVLQPTIVHLALDGRERDIPIDDLQAGEFFVVRPGERVPADGKVVSGKSAIDQGAFTGESLPVDKEPGDRVFAGTLNQFGALTVVAEQIGRHTALARIADLVGSAANRKAGLERTADRLARWFLPAVLVAALLTWIGWRILGGTWQRGVLPALSVLVVACPCPLVLATPAAVMAALAWLGRRGVIVRGSQSLEELSRVNTFAFDKTGTLTQGSLALGQIIATGDLESLEILRLAAAAERHSEHLLARLIVREANERGMTIPVPAEFETFEGAGVIASVARTAIVNSRPGMTSRVSGGTRSTQLSSDSEHATVVVGNRRILDRIDIAFAADIAQQIKDRETAGESPLVVAVDGRIVGILCIRETIRPESQRVLHELRDAGISRFALLTGDRPQPADAVVRAMGLFDEVATEQLPADKARWIEATRQSGGCVAMVGDGINDAPALAAANVGLVISRVGADLAADAGDILLLGDPLRPLPGLLRLSRALVQNISQSIIIFAFGMNGLGVLASSFGWFSPVGAALFHEIASLAVMINAMRLLWFDSGSASLLYRWQTGLLASADRLVGALSPSRWVYWLLERWQVCVKLIAASGFAAWMLSAVVLVNSDEQAIVTRFGRFQALLPAGLHWRWPWPLEAVVRERIDQLRHVEFGFRNAPFRQQNLNPEIIEWTNPHEDRDHPAPADESLLLTGDEVPVELTAEAVFLIKDLKQFQFAGTRRPDDVVRATAECVLRDLAAQVTLDQLLTDRRRQLERQSLTRLRHRIEQYSLGIEVLDLQWLDVHPPKAVVPAYRQVADALEDRELLRNEAETYAERALLGAIGEDGVRLLKEHAHPIVASDTNSDDHQTLNDAAWERLMSPQPDGRSLLSGNAAAILDEAQVASVRRRTAATATSRSLERMLAEYHKSPLLTIERLYWNTVIQAFASQSLTIVDPRAAQRQQLWLRDVPGIPPLPSVPAPSTESKTE